MTRPVDFLWLLPILPLISAVVIRLFGGSLLNRKVVGSIASLSVLGSLVLAIRAVLLQVGLEDGTVLIQDILPWIQIDTLNVAWRFHVDELSGSMLLIITGIGFLIHVYSMGYMAHEEAFARYFSYINLFMSMMLILVLSDSLLGMFVGWEGVGFCSYLLIGFYHQDHANADAGKKAFIVNRIGDLGVLVGMFALLWGMHELTGRFSLTFADIVANAQGLSGLTVLGFGLVGFATLALFVGATGKSAQIPLYVWLPDAMAGPTPVSALIHAATMVTAGVYMVARLSFLFDLAPFSLDVMAWVGGITAIFSATMALVQNDIKKVLAYSTVSQLGYMFLACGCGAYVSGMFHVTTHAAFKALLFLGAGSVIHAVANNQDIRKMGGLRKEIPITYVTFLVGALALSGIFPLAGFFSKDEILWQAWNKSPVLWALGLLTAGMTAFYMFRLFFKVFHGSFRGEREVLTHVHESPWTMTGPLIVLALLSIGLGWLWWPAFMPLAHVYPDHLGETVVLHHVHGSHALEILLAAVSLGLALASIGLAYWMYGRRSKAGLPVSEKLKWRFSSLHRLLLNKYWIDELYAWTVVRGFHVLARAFATFDRKVVDGLVHLAAWAFKWVAFIKGLFDSLVVDGLVQFQATWAHFLGKRLANGHNGQVQVYVSVAFACIVFAMGSVALIWLYAH